MRNQPPPDIFDNLRAGKYDNSAPFASKKVDEEAWRTYQQKAASLYDQFRADLLAHLGLEEGPAADALFAFAWEKGHSAGFSEVALEALEAADLLKAGAAGEAARLGARITALEEENRQLREQIDAATEREASLNAKLDRHGLYGEAAP